MPEKLVPIRESPQSEPAHADGAALQRRGIASYVKRLQWPDGQFAVLVDERDAERALAALEDLSPHLSAPVLDRDPPLRCPCCSSSDVLPQPPYPLITLLIGFGAVCTCLYVNQGAVALVVGLMTVAVASIAFAKAARWRCASCHRRYGSGASG